MDSINSSTSDYNGRLVFFVTRISTTIPIPNATIQVYSTEEPDVLLYTLITNSSGQTEAITLPTPPLSYSLNADSPQPFSQYRFIIVAEGYEPLTINGSEMLADETSIQPAALVPIRFGTGAGTIDIPIHTLVGDYPSKTPEAEIKPEAETGEIVLSRVVIPETIIVHDGVPDDRTAPNYYVPYRDYIKNVVSSEIFPTWPESTIYANALVIMSFTLNRVYTEWYRNRGYDFTITSSTAFDQKFIYGRNIYANIDRIVDSIFNNYLSRPGVKQPIFTSYCDGKRTTCRGLSQWGSMYLGEEGYSAIDIIRYYYGNDMFINTADQIEGVPASWPGYDLTIGSRGSKVLQLQQQLNRIKRNYPALPGVSEDGIYGPGTAEAVRSFQQIFNLNPTGVTDFATWYSISNIYVGVTEISEP